MDQYSNFNDTITYLIDGLIDSGVKDPKAIISSLLGKDGKKTIDPYLYGALEQYILAQVPDNIAPETLKIRLLDFLNALFKFKMTFKDVGRCVTGPYFLDKESAAINLICYNQTAMPLIGISLDRDDTINVSTSLTYEEAGDGDSYKLKLNIDKDKRGSYPFDYYDVEVQEVLENMIEDFKGYGLSEKEIFYGTSLAIKNMGGAEGMYITSLVTEAPSDPINMKSFKINTRLSNLILGDDQKTAPISIVDEDGETLGFDAFSFRIERNDSMKEFANWYITYIIDTVLDGVKSDEELTRNNSEFNYSINYDDSIDPYYSPESSSLEYLIAMIFKFVINSIKEKYSEEIQSAGLDKGSLKSMSVEDGLKAYSDIISYVKGSKGVSVKYAYLSDTFTNYGIGNEVYDTALLVSMVKESINYINSKLGTQISIEN